MFQLSQSNNRQHQTLALNSLIMNNIFNLANCFNQFGAFDLRAGFRHHPFFVCVLLLAVFLQVSLTELNAFGLENLNPIQWFVCFVFALLSALIAPLTGQQNRHRGLTSGASKVKTPLHTVESHQQGNNRHHEHPHHHHYDHSEGRYHGQQQLHQQGHLVGFGEPAAAKNRNNQSRQATPRTPSKSPMGAKARSAARRVPVSGATHRKSQPSSLLDS